MQVNYRNLSVLGGALLALFLTFSLTEVGAQQNQEGQKPGREQAPKTTSPQTAQKEDEPEALTKRAEVAKASMEEKKLLPGELAAVRYPTINNKGEVSFIGIFEAAPETNAVTQTIFVRAADGGWRATRAGEKVESAKDDIVQFSNVSLSDNGDLTFIGTLAGLTAPPPPAHESNQIFNRNTGVFVKTAAGIKLVVRLGDEVPNMPSVFSNFSNPSSNSKGVTAFIAAYADPDGRGLFFCDNGKVTLATRSGQKIGNGEEGVFSEHYYPSDINERGEVAFFGRVGLGGGIFVASQSGVKLIAFQGKPTPIKGANFLGFGNRAPEINDNGDVLFSAFYDGPNAGRGLFLKPANGPLQVVAKSGTTIPDTTYNFTDFNFPSLNSKGEMAFLGFFGGRNRGVFTKTAKGFEVVALMDQKIPGGGQDEILNNFHQPQINDRGEVVFLGQLRSGMIAVMFKDAQGLKVLARRGSKIPAK